MLSFSINLLIFCEAKIPDPADVVFAQRLPALIEHLVLAGPEDNLDERLILQAEALLAYVISPDHRLMIINNVGKSSVAGKTLKYVLKLRGDRTPETYSVIAEFIKHLAPSPPQKPLPDTFVAAFRLFKPDLQRQGTRALMNCYR